MGQAGMMRLKTEGEEVICMYLHICIYLHVNMYMYSFLYVLRMYIFGLYMYIFGIVYVNIFGCAYEWDMSRS